MDLAEKLKAIRANEQVSQSEICQLLGMSLSTYKKYEGALFEMGYGALTKLTQHPRFKKYTLWLMTDDVGPECGQISPIE
ncbi:helix-turn-helix domain-containing protein [Pseudomonas sp. 15A4]|uniref:helix-turn-helix domain-containing protein n=1 Tax=Pseudomonas sp. 15A4 TaxID=2804761 RepID=UPI0019675E7A|nr:helix-turn-helix transcriptional regulator [Pseudomonas sp. 15A4]QSB20637.1 helix-turn-helix domain-containing protein [Pseudomonas sp. 15A4]